MTLSFLRNHTLNQLKDLSKQLYEMISAAYQERQRLIDIDSFDDVENAKLCQISEPQFYYYFRFFNKGLSIIRRFSTNRKPVYSIFCENYKITCYIKGHPLPHYDFKSSSYGEYDTLDEAKIVFKNLVIELLQSEFNFDYQQVLEIF